MVFKPAIERNYWKLYSENDGQIFLEKAQLGFYIIVSVLLVLEFCNIVSL